QYNSLSQRRPTGGRFAVPGNLRSHLPRRYWYRTSELVSPEESPMFRPWLLAATSVAILGTAVIAILLMPSGSPVVRAAEKAQPPGGEKTEEAATVALPIGEVKLFSSGVGYFQREGSVEGSSRVDLAFPVSDINDLIKSMVLRDLDGGHIS